MSKCALPLAVLAGLATVGGSLLGAASGVTANTAYADTNTAGNSQVNTRLASKYVTVTTDGTVNIEVVPTSAGSMAVSKSTVNVKTNSENGYRLFVSGVKHDEGSTAAPLYFNGNETSSARLAAVGSSPAAFSTKNTWGYAVPSVAGAGYADVSKYASAAAADTIVDSGTIGNLLWKGMTTDYAQVKTTNAANESGDLVDVYYGVYVDTNTISGNYLNTVVYTAFVEGSDEIAMSKSTIKNGETNVDLTLDYQSATRPVVLSGASKNVEAIVKFVNGGTEVGECNGLTAVNDGTSDQLTLRCASITAKNNPANDTMYGIAVTLRFDDGVELAYSADGVWKYNNTLADITTMQQMSASICAATPGYASNSATYTLTDERDGKAYAVRKLADNECWMTQNLDLDLVYDAASNTMGTTLGNSFNPFTNENTNIASSKWSIPNGSQGYTTQTADGAYWNQYGCANSSYSAAWTSSDYSSTAYCAAGYEVRSRRLDDCTTYSGAYGTTDTVAACDTATGVANTKRNGVMYNYVAATAGSRSYSDAAGEASGSICPKGWRLPTGGVSGEMHAMFVAQGVIKSEADGGVAGELTAGVLYPTGSNALVVGTTRFQQIITAMASDPISAVRSGNYTFANARMDYRGAAGYWWSSTATSAGTGYSMQFYTGDYYPGTGSYSKGFGFGLRCIAE